MYTLLCLAAALALGQAEPEEPAKAPAEAPAQEARPTEHAPAAREARKAPPSTEPSPQPGAGPQKPPPEAERALVARAALSFLDALLAGDARALAAACGDRFSFDGEVRAGKDQIRRAFQDLIADRDPLDRPALLDLELVPFADALARFGPPPARLLPVATVRGSWVALANLSRRPLLLFLSREGSRFTVAGME